MSAGLDMSLDEIISKKRPSRSIRGRPTRASGIVKRSGGPIRNSRPLQAGSRPYGVPSVAASNVGSAPEGKILVSNLAYKVTEADLWVNIYCIRKLYKAFPVGRESQLVRKGDARESK